MNKFFKKSASRIIYHLGRLGTAAIQLVGVILLIVARNHSLDYEYMGSPFVEALIGLLLIAGAVFLESRISEYDEIWHYVLCVLSSPVRVVCQIVTLVRVILATVNGDEQFAKRGLVTTSLIEYFFYVFFGWEYEPAVSARRARETARREASRAADEKYAAIDARKKAEQEARKASLPDDRNGQIFISGGNMVSPPPSGYSYSEQRGFRNGSPCIIASFTLDWNYKEGYSLDALWEEARLSAEVWCEREKGKNYRAYCKRVRNPVSEPTLTLNLRRGKMRK